MELQRRWSLIFSEGREERLPGGGVSPSIHSPAVYKHWALFFFFLLIFGHAGSLCGLSLVVVSRGYSQFSMQASHCSSFLC